MKTLILLLLMTCAGCSQKPRAVDTSQRINSGVNILPEVVLASQKQAPSTKPTSEDERDLIDVISDSDQQHYKLIEVLRTSGLVPMLQEVGPYTILAPTDDAFDKLPPGVLDQLLLPSHHAELVTFVKYHLLKGRIDFNAMLHTNGMVPTVAGSDIIIKGINQKVLVNNEANLIRSDGAATNGMIHWVDTVLIPPT